jgi:hypothetical protein
VYFLSAGWLQRLNDNGTATILAAMTGSVLDVGPEGALYYTPPGRIEKLQNGVRTVVVNHGQLLDGFSIAKDGTMYMGSQGFGCGTGVGFWKFSPEGRLTTFVASGTGT